MNLFDTPHRRYNPLIGEWLLVSPQRVKRPWQGQIEPPPPKRPAYDPNCYLCPGNKRANGEPNPHYADTFVFTNDFAALLPKNTAPDHTEHMLCYAKPVEGTCRVICFSPHHDLTLASMPVAGIKKVVNVWIDQIAELERTYTWVQVFENKGATLGCSNPHPHGQIWASNSLPNEIIKEDRMQKEYLQKHHTRLLQDYATLEQNQTERIVIENSDWLVVVPFWATWPFETLLLPKFPISHLPALTEPQKNTLTDILKKLLATYDNVFETEFPYAMGWHGRPANHANNDHWQLHAHFYPPLLRSATIRKFVAGYELLAELQRDTTPEDTAQRLRAHTCNNV